MLRPRKESDPLASKRRLLAAQEKLLSERMSKLNDQLTRGGEEEDGPAKPAEPPVWRLGEESPRELRSTETSPQRGPDLARQRQRDKVIFIVTMVALVVVVIIFLSVAHSHVKAL